MTIHHDKATSHTANYTARYIKNINTKYGISFLDKADIPVKGTDISPMDFFIFSYIKQGVKKWWAKSELGVWKKCQEMCNNLSSETYDNVFKSWRKRCEAISNNGDGDVEQMKYIH